MNAERRPKGAPPEVRATSPSIQAAAAARRRRDRLRILLSQIATLDAELRDVANEARDNRDHVVFGFKTFAGYVNYESAQHANLQRLARRWAGWR
jgi:hypothetical protein